MTRYGMLIDLKSCIGCRACMTACKCNHDIPVGEYKGREYYRIWPKEEELGRYPYVVRNFTPLLCMQCAAPPCVEACPIPGAIYKREDGIILVDWEKCDGCRRCIQACPYDAIYLRGDKGVVDKCTFCYELVDRGLKPECVKACASDAMLFGDLDDPESRISELIKSLHARPLNPEYGTTPSVYYTAHAGRMRGTVWDPMAEKPVQAASVVLKESDTGMSFSTTTDANGVFFFWRLNVGKTYNISIEAEGYSTKKQRKELMEEYAEIGKIPIQKV